MLARTVFCSTTSAASGPLARASLSNCLSLLRSALFFFRIAFIFSRARACFGPPMCLVICAGKGGVCGRL
jgi:hypothetical protein